MSECPVSRQLRLLRVVHAHPLAGAERRLHDPQRPLTHDRLLYVLQQQLGRIASMPATGQLETFGSGAKIPRKQSLAGERETLRPSRSTAPVPAETA
jgi:hypothetical protein